MGKAKAVAAVLTLKEFYDILSKCGNDAVKALYEIKAVLETEED